MADRRLIWFDDWALLLGAVAGVLVFSAGSAFLDPAWQVAMVPAGLVASKWLAHRLSADARRGIRSLSVSYASGADGVHAYGDRAGLERCVAELTAMDRAIVDRVIDDHEYLRRWAGVYDSLPRMRNRGGTATRTHRTARMRSSPGLVG